jgi:hypothetical protein
MVAPSFSPTSSNTTSAVTINPALVYLKSQLPEQYHSMILPSANAAVQPLWSCKHIRGESLSSSILPKNDIDKFNFVHVFKTAGSTLRTFLHDYTARCPSKSFATLSGCTSVSMQRASSDVWDHCILKDRRQKGKYKFVGRSPVPKHSLDAFDIIGGHFRLGLMDYLPKPSQKTTNARVTNHRHLVFVRNATLKYISGKVYIKKNAVKNLTADFIIRDLQREVRHRRKHHSKYANYLLTPAQEDRMRREKWSSETSARVMMQNLVEYNVTIGVTDDMRSSMNLLEAIMDPHGHVPDLFVRYGGGRSNVTKSTKRNASPISSEVILETIRRNHPSTYDDVVEFVKYEQQVTDFAVAFQQLQLQAMDELRAFRDSRFKRISQG